MESALTDPGTLDLATRFEGQLRQNQPESAAAVLRTLRFWRGLHSDCYLAYGKATETSLFPMIDISAATGKAGAAIWPFGIYPVTGTVEVVFQYLRSRAPFDDTALRRELMDRLNQVDGIELPEAKLELRPSFSLDMFTDHAAEIQGVLEWFTHTVALHLAQQAP